jgi:hypothetical protein
LSANCTPNRMPIRTQNRTCRRTLSRFFFYFVYQFELLSGNIVTSFLGIGNLGGSYGDLVQL